MSATNPLTQPGGYMPDNPAGTATGGTRLDPAVAGALAHKPQPHLIPAAK
jgi:hypothetical protein